MSTSFYVFSALKQLKDGVTTVGKYVHGVQTAVDLAKGVYDIATSDDPVKETIHQGAKLASQGVAGLAKGGLDMAAAVIAPEAGVAGQFGLFVVKEVVGYFAGKATGQAVDEAGSYLRPGAVAAAA